MQSVNNLVFSGQCREAFEFYAQALEGKITQMISFGQAPEGVRLPENYDHKIMHAWLDIGDQAIMGCDAPPDFQCPMSGFSVAFHSSDVEHVARIFDALADGAKVSMPFAPAPWSSGFGMLTDKFGVPWIVNTRSSPPSSN